MRLKFQLVPLQAPCFMTKRQGRMQAKYCHAIGQPFFFPPFFDIAISLGQGYHPQKV